MANQTPNRSQRLGEGWALAYAPGDWYIIAAQSTLVVLPKESDTKVIDELWQAMQQWNTRVEDVINVITRQRTIPLSLVPDFLVLSRQSSSVRVAVRGSGVLDLATTKGTQRATGAASNTWVEGEVEAFTAAQWVANERDTTPPTLPLVNGVVRAGALVWTAPEFDWNESAPAASAQPAEPAAHSDAKPESARAEAPVAPLHSSEPKVLGTIRLSTGETVQVDRNVILGRSPKIESHAGESAPRLVEVPSPKQDISRSHVELVVTGTQVQVMDLGSTNGTVLRRAGEKPLQLVPGSAQTLTFGDRVDIGAAVYFTYHEPTA